MGPEKLAEAKAAVDLHKRQQARKAAGLPEEEPEEEAARLLGEGEGEEEEEDAWEAAFDKWITRIAAGAGVVVLIVAVAVGVHNWWVQDGGGPAVGGSTVPAGSG